MQHRLGLLSSAPCTKRQYIREVKGYIAFREERGLDPLNSSPTQLSIYQQQKAAGKADATVTNTRIAVNLRLSANGQPEIAKPRPAKD